MSFVGDAIGGIVKGVGSIFGGSDESTKVAQTSTQGTSSTVSPNIDIRTTNTINMDNQPIGDAIKYVGVLNYDTQTKLVNIVAAQTMVDYQEAQNAAKTAETNEAVKTEFLSSLASFKSVMGIIFVIAVLYFISRKGGLKIGKGT